MKRSSSVCSAVQAVYLYNLRSMHRLANLHVTHCSEFKMSK